MNKETIENLVKVFNALSELCDSWGEEDQETFNEWSETPEGGWELPSLDEVTGDFYTFLEFVWNKRD